MAIFSEGSYIYESIDIDHRNHRRCRRLTVHPLSCCQLSRRNSLEALPQSCSQDSYDEIIIQIISFVETTGPEIKSGAGLSFTVDPTFSQSLHMSCSLRVQGISTFPSVSLHRVRPGNSYHTLSPLRNLCTQASSIG